MFARVAVWEGVTPDAMREGAEMMNSSDGPPPGVPSSAVIKLDDPENGRTIVIGLFDSQDDLRAGDEALRAMDRPDVEGLGEIKSIDFYEVSVDRRR